VLQHERAVLRNDRNAFRHQAIFPDALIHFSEGTPALLGSDGVLANDNPGQNLIPESLAKWRRRTLGGGAAAEICLIMLLP
jgi:hypothetical protein